VPEVSKPGAQPEAVTGTLRRTRLLRDHTQPLETVTARETSLPGRGQKRTNTGLTLVPADEESEPPRTMRAQRPQRAANPSRRALEALENNTLIRTNSQHMDIDSDVDS
jgi:hypothetical protein